MQIETNYFAYCLDTNTKKNYFIVPSKYLKPRPQAKHSNPGVAWDTLGQQFWGGVFQSAWNESLEVDPDDGSFLDQKPDKDFGQLLTEAEYKECLVLATASSVEELQQYVQTCNIKVPNKYRRLDDSDASGSQQHDELQQQNEQLFRCGESNQQESSIDHSMVSQSSESEPVSARETPLLKPPEVTVRGLPDEISSGKTPTVTEKELEEPIKSHDVSENNERSETHIRPEGVANLGFFEIETDGIVTRKNADNVCVLVIHYKFKDNPLETFRNGDACDVENLKTFFGKNRNCNIRNLQSPDKKTLIQLLGDEEKLLQFFNTQDDVPSVFWLFILSHGSENGTIATDHFDDEIEENEYFTTDEVFDSLQRLKRFKKCLKIVNFGPCRGSLDDSKFDLKNSYTKYANRNSCRITTRHGMQNFVVFYSTVETTMANTNKTGSWFVSNICLCLNNTDDESLLKFFTIVQSRMHVKSRDYRTFANTPLGQTPELKMFQQDKKFFISKTKTTAKPVSNYDAKRDTSKVRNEPISPYFSWKSDEGQDIRGRRGFLLSVVQSKQVLEMKRVLQNLDFEIRDWILSGSSMEFYFKMVTEMEPDVGCIMTCIFGPVCENEQNEVCVRVQKDKEIPITDILHSLVGPNNDKLIGKPKILFVVNMEAPQTDNIFVHMKDLQVSATNHSGWLVLILRYEDALEQLIELFGNISEKSLQELLEPLLTRESKREDAVLLNSTLQYLIQFPIWSRAFVKPDFKVKKTKLYRNQMVCFENSTEPHIEEKIDFETLLKKVKHFLENSQISSDTGSSLMSNPVRDLNAVSEASDVWIFNSIAGSGKSTILGEMAQQLSKLDGELKILQIPLKKYYQYLQEIPVMSVDEIGFLEKTTCNSQADIKHWIEKRELIVFLDGFDEVCSEFREKIIKILIALINARVPLFIGTRPHEVHHIQERIKNSTIVEIEPLDEEKQIEFLRIVARKNPNEIEELRKIFKDQGILGNPLYLTLLAEYTGDGNLYKIFENIVRCKVEIGLKRENGGKDVGEETIDKLLKLNQFVASRFVTGVNKIDDDSVTQEELEKMNAVGVVTYSKNSLVFPHQMFAEFLTAQKFVYDLKNPGNEKVPLFNDDLMQCRKFVDLFFSTKIGIDASYAEAFKDFAELNDPLELVKIICRENLIQMFLMLNLDLSLKDEDGKNALHFALRHLEMVKMVHERNSNLATETTNNGESCLHLAIDDEKCSEEVAIWLMQNTQVDKNAETKTKNTPLLLAGARKKWEVVQSLVFTNVELNKFCPDGKSILYYAILSNKLGLVKELIDRGSSISLKDQNGDTALHLAARANTNPEIVKILLKNGAEVNAENNDKWTALHCAARYNPVSEIVQMLLENGADIHSRNKDGHTAHHLAARSNTNPEIVKILLENGVPK